MGEIHSVFSPMAVGIHLGMGMGMGIGYGVCVQYTRQQVVHTRVHAFVIIPQRRQICDAVQNCYAVVYDKALVIII